MIASVIGKIFLQAYNEKFGLHYSAKEFFIKEYFPLFFGYGTYMQWIINSPFTSGLRKGKKPTSEECQKKLKVLLDKIENNTPDASFAIGYPALELTATTSGQVTNMDIRTNQEDVFASWIGSGLGIGIQGGMSILFDDPRVLLAIHEGWRLYRDFLNTNGHLRGNQINSWNGQWLTHRFSDDYKEYNPGIDFDPLVCAKGGMEVKVQDWLSVLVAIARKINIPRMMGYVYSLGQMNTTIGFIPFYLGEIKAPFELYRKFFEVTTDESIAKAWECENGFMVACQRGAIGLEAMEPKGLKPYMRGKDPVYDTRAEEKIINFRIKQIWLLAMLSDKELWNKALEVAKLFKAFEKGAAKGKTDRKNLIGNIMHADRVVFFDYLGKMIMEDGDSLASVGAMQLWETIIDIPIDKHLYFIVLVRFHYAVLTKQE